MTEDGARDAETAERRLSNYLLWQVADSELVFSERLWPGCSCRDLEAALAEYRERTREHGHRRPGN